LKRTPLQRKTGLKRTGGLTSRPKRKGVHGPMWHHSVARGKCKVCAHRPVDAATREGFALLLETLDAHHVTPLQTLKREGVPETAWYDARNGMALCRFHHGRHESGMERVPQELLTDDHWQFAAEHNLTYILQRMYPLTM